MHASRLEAEPAGNSSAVLPNPYYGLLTDFRVNIR